MKEIFTKRWFEAAAIRAIKTMAQTFVATIGTAAVLQEVNWKLTISAAILSGILSMATSLAGLPEVETEPVLMLEEEDEEDEEEADE